MNQQELGAIAALRESTVKIGTPENVQEILKGLFQTNLVMNKLNRYLLTIIGFGWLSFLLAGILLNQVFAAPNFVLLIERSYCPPSKVGTSSTRIYQFISATSTKS